MVSPIDIIIKEDHNPSRTLVDWFSFTLACPMMCKPDEHGRPHFPSIVRDEFPHICDYLMSFDDLEFGKGRKMFSDSVRSSSAGVTIFMRPTLNFTLFEFSGTGCDMLRKRKSLRDILKLYGNRATRIDIAVDIECTIDPREFAEQRDTKRFTSFSIDKSEAGVTHYVGSRKSDRFARVYRYAAPHPRSHLLRVEHVLRNDEAKQLALLTTSSSLQSIVSALGNSFGWHHPVWGQKRTDAPLKSAPREAKQGHTERWLLSAVLPACQRLIDEGSIDFVALFEKMLYDLIQQHKYYERSNDDTHTISHRTDDNPQLPEPDMRPRREVSKPMGFVHD